MKENKEEKECQFLGYSQIKHTLSPGDFVSVNINEKGLIVIDATEIEEDTPQIPEWEERYKKFIEKQVNLTPREVSLFKDFLISEISQAEERGRRRGIEETIKLLPYEKPMSVFSFVLRGEELEQYMRHKGWNDCRSFFREAIKNLIKSTK